MKSAYMFVRDRTTRLLQYAEFRIAMTSFFFDTPKSDYQPLPWVGIESAQVRGEATIERWTAIKASIPKDGTSLKDVGCSVGYFCHQFASRVGTRSVGIDGNPTLINVANYVSNRAGLAERESFCHMRVDPDSVRLLPNTDITLLLSIWHHWVYEYGLDAATKMLISVWQTTSKVMFFESGQEEVAEEFKLPFQEDAALWLENYLGSVLPNSQVSVIGEFGAGSYKHYHIKQGSRSLFKVTRDAHKE